MVSFDVQGSPVELPETQERKPRGLVVATQIYVLLDHPGSFGERESNLTCAYFFQMGLVKNHQLVNVFPCLLSETWWIFQQLSRLLILSFSHCDRTIGILETSVHSMTFYARHDDFKLPVAVLSKAKTFCAKWSNFFASSVARCFWVFRGCTTYPWRCNFDVEAWGNTKRKIATNRCKNRSANTETDFLFTVSGQIFLRPHTTKNPKCSKLEGNSPKISGKSRLLKH